MRTGIGHTSTASAEGVQDLNQKQRTLETADEPCRMDEWAITVNELEAGEFHFSLLRVVDRSDDLLGYRPELTGDTAHARPVDAWIAGILALRSHAAPKARSGQFLASDAASGYSLGG